MGLVMTLTFSFVVDDCVHQAFLTYQRAAEGGSEQAWRNLAAMYALGQGTEKNETIAAHILKTIKGQGEGK
jgi:TPR repeat protein